MGITSNFNTTSLILRVKNNIILATIAYIL